MALVLACSSRLAAKLVGSSTQKHRSAWLKQLVVLHPRTLTPGPGKNSPTSQYGYSKGLSKILDVKITSTHTAKRTFVELHLDLMTAKSVPALIYLRRSSSATAQLDMSSR